MNTRRENMQTAFGLSSGPVNIQNRVGRPGVGNTCRVSRDNLQTPKWSMVASLRNNSNQEFYEDIMPKLEIGWAHKFFSEVEKKIVEVTGGPDPESRWLEGNYHPVAREVNGECPIVHGRIPKALYGAYLRTGFNSALRPRVSYHPFDGDGMVHMVRLQRSGASYANRFVRTKKFELETKFQRQLVMRFSEVAGFRGLALISSRLMQLVFGLVPRAGLRAHGLGTANTSIVWQANQLMSLQDGDAPFAIRGFCSGIVETLKLLPEMAKGMAGVSGHPKTDPETGETYSITTRMMRGPYASVICYNADGSLKKKIPLRSVKTAAFMHDFALTENFVVLSEGALQFNVGKMLLNDASVGFNKNAPTRFCVLPKHATDERDIQWFELPEASWMSHVAGAWEEGPLIKVSGIRYEDVKFQVAAADGFDYERVLCIWTFDTTTGKSWYERIVPSDVASEFPVTNPLYANRRAKYIWFPEETTVEGLPVYSGINKVDVDAGLEDANKGIVKTLSFGEDMYGGEMVFKPRSENPKECDGEDDGYLMGYIHNERTNISYFAVYDAKTMDTEPVCLIQLPQRVPYGLHGIHINEMQFQTQLGRRPAQKMLRRDRRVAPAKRSVEKERVHVRI